MQKSITTLQEALTVELQRLYNGETRLKENILAILPTVKSESFRSVLIEYSEGADDKRLKIDRMLSYLCAEVGSQTNEVMEKLMIELQSKVFYYANDIRELLLIPVFQQVCYYKISGYKAALTLAMELELEVVADLIEQIIEWERKTDKLLMDLAFHEFSKIDGPLSV